MKTKGLFFVILFALVTGQSIAQKYAVAPASTMTIIGTSNLHDWETVATEVNGFIEYGTEDDGTKTVRGASLVIPVESIKSEKGNKMDKLTYKALNADTHKQIRFELDNAEIGDSGTAAEANVTGDLTVNGVTKPVELVAQSTSGELMTWTGSVDMKMTDFGVDPPKALLGALKTGDEITVKFNIILE